MESRWTLRAGLVAERLCQVDGSIDRHDQMALGEPGLQRGGALQATVRRAVILAFQPGVEALVEIGDAGQLVGVQRGQELLADGFFYGREFVNDEDLNAQALRWLEGTANVRRHGAAADTDVDRGRGPPCRWRSVRSATTRRSRPAVSGEAFATEHLRAVARFLLPAEHQAFR